MYRASLSVAICLFTVLLCSAPAKAQGRDRKGPQSASFAGLWSTTFGPVEFTQRGERVTGTYGYDEKKIAGTADGETLAFEFQDSSGSITLWQDGRTFTGTYTWNEREHGWGGYRIAPKVARPDPGEITEGQSESWLNYHLRVPRGFKKAKRYPAIAFFHGSNMSSSAYVNTIAARWPQIAKRYILVGFDGEHLSPYAKDGQRAHNFTYVNFSGPERGPEAVHRQSPALVAEALDELGTQLPITHWFVGGHSQGGYLSYALQMFYPEKVRGVFPMSCGLIVQCEPDYAYFAERGADFQRAQREVAVAIIHAENDQVVGFSAGKYAHRAMVDGGFPATRFFTHESAAHMFAHLPVDRAVEWLEAITSTEIGELLAFARARIKAGHFRDASAALLRVEALSKGKARGKTKPLWKKIDRAAAEDGARFAAAIRSNRNAEWVDAFLEFRQEFAFTPTARAALAAYSNLREKHASKADAVFYKARNSRDTAARRELWREIADEYYASKWYPHVKDWLEN